MSTDSPADSLRITRIIDAPREEVFRAWTEPEQIRRWWGPGEFSCPEAEVDLRPGRSYRLAMQPAEGDPFIVALIARWWRPLGSSTHGAGKPAPRPTAPSRS